MSNPNKKNSPAIDALLAEADKLNTNNEEKKTVPSQTTTETAADQDVTPEETTAEPKKTLGQRLDAMTAKLREQKKLIGIVGASASVAAVAFVAFAKASAKKAIEETLTESEVPVETSGESESVDES